MIDTRLYIETPEGADLPIDPAGVTPRALAFMIDTCIKLVAIVGFSFLVGYFGGLGKGVNLIFTFLLEWFYSVFFEVYRGGQTPGKKRLGIVVIQDDGSPVNFSVSLTRNLLRVIDFLPFAYLTGLISCLLNKEFKRVGDFAAGTSVVYQSKSVFVTPQRVSKGDAAVKAPLDQKTVQGSVNSTSPNHGSPILSPTLSPTFSPIPTLDFDEKRAILEFSDRHTQLSVARRNELAKILSPALGEHASSEKSLLFLAKIFRG